MARLNQLVAAERIPFEVHTDGRRIYRREQLGLSAFLCKGLTWL